MGSAYSVKRAANGALGDGNWNNPLWQSASELSVANFSAKGSGHHPRTLARLMYDDQHLFARFEVHDQYVLAKAAEYQAMVCEDSCAEFFTQPKEGKGYFNFEMNCGGTLLLFYIEDSTRTPTGFVKYTKVSKEIAGEMVIHHSLPKIVMPELTEPTIWHVSYRIPFSLFEKFVGPLGKIAGTTWRGNFFKCADKSSHPHWASWAPLTALNFHLPQCFGEIHFE